METPVSINYSPKLHIEVLIFIWKKKSTHRELVNTLNNFDNLKWKREFEIEKITLIKKIN